MKILVLCYLLAHGSSTPLQIAGGSATRAWELHPILAALDEGGRVAYDWHPPSTWRLRTVLTETELKECRK